MEINTLIPYIYGSVSIIIIVLLYIAYSIWRVKRMIIKEVENSKIVNYGQNTGY